ncbi:response regulator [Paucibacter sp. TC2R-5]|uniref:response regulator n=1 Tax=Paucibacter sp. TC2R-5 TaxID=2893555 RepID=UPI0021E4B33E|nr:response regulator [Paucibacter sp. TC2R-5]MCV2360082.1 response regulator [Paucibacter sp. TC2R-5]
MQSAPLRDDEAQSLAALRALEVLDTGPEAEFDALVRAASIVCGVPISLISLIDVERQWFKANIGLPGVHETPRDLAFCAHAVLGDELFEVADATQDPRFADNPLVISQPDIRFYAGAPVRLSDGSRIGTLCVIDRQPKRLTEAQRQVLTELAVAAAQALEGRRALRAVKQISREMADSEARFRLLSESVPIGVFELDVQGNFSYGNSKLLDIFGLQHRQALDWTQMVDADERKVITTMWRDALAQQEDMDAEFRIRRADGRVRQLHAKAKLRRNEAGQPLAYVGMVEDITEARQQQDALRTSRAFLDRTGRMAGVGGWEIDLATNSLFWSDETCRIHGLEPGHRPSLEEALDFYTPEARPVVQQAVQHALATGEGWDLELEQQLRDGRKIWVHAVGSVEFEDGQARRLVGAFQDVTERVKERLALKEAHTLMQLATDSGGIGIWDYDLVQGSLKWDAWMYRLYGQMPSDELGPYDLWARHLHPDDKAVAEHNLQDAIEGRRPFATEFRVIWSDGSVHHIRGTALIKRDEAGRALRMVGVNWDTSEHHRIEAELREAKLVAEGASKAKSEFLANMSHEIRTPMNAILGMLTLLRKTKMSERQADYAAKTEGAARSLLGLLNEILDFSKVEAGKMTLDPQTMRVDHLLRDLSVILSANVGAKKLELVFDIDPALPRELVADAMRLQQVLINLTGNSIKFTEQGEVVLAIKVLQRNQDSVSLHFAVSDTGIGIAPQNQARIFSGFTQAEASTTRRFGGTGLGLAISQRLVALMGGELTLQSEEGRGSRFEFSLTLALADTAVAATALGEKTDPPAAQRRALIVDDNAIAREVLARMCESQGWMVDLAESGEQAIACLQAHAHTAAGPYQALFVDWQMPGLDGWQTIGRIRAQGLAGPAPVIVMVTALGREQLAQRSEADQAMLDGYLVKPVTASMLFDAVADAGLHPSLLLAKREAAMPHAEQQRLLGVRLLLVEDNLNNQQVASELLRGEGASVQIAGDGQQAVSALAAAPHAFDVVLMDLQMPVMDGYAATHHLREVLGLRALPIVAMTANAMSSDREACLAAGMNDHVGKPFDLDELVRVLRQHGGLASLDGARRLAPQQGGELTAAWSRAAAGAGVDLSAALQRMGGKPTVYARMLRNFTADLGAMQSQLREHLAQADARSALRLIHTLKGVAATLGAVQLAEQASQAERALTEALADQGAEGSVAEALLLASVERCCVAMVAAMPGLTELLRVMQDEANAAAPLALADSAALPALGELPVAELQDLTQALSELLLRLQDSDMDALQVMSVLQSRYGAVLGGRLQGLDEALGRLEFEAAILPCRDLISEVKGILQ